MTSSRQVLARPLSGALLRAVLLALAVALLSAASALALSQESAVQNEPTKWKQVRVVNDAATGTRWLLERDTATPGAPGRMRQIAAGRAVAGYGAALLAAAVAAPIMRAGDRVVVEDSAEKVTARLEGTVLEPARAGALVKVRLAAGGQTVTARALAPGRATLVAAQEGSTR